MAAFVQNMAVTLLVGVLRIDKWFDIYDHRCELRAGMEEIVRVTIKNSTSQRAAYNISINEGGNTRRDQVKVGMIGLKADGSFDGDIKPIDSGWVDVPVGQSVDVSIGAMDGSRVLLYLGDSRRRRTSCDRAAVYPRTVRRWGLPPQDFRGIGDYNSRSQMVIVVVRLSEPCWHCRQGLFFI